MNFKKLIALLLSCAQVSLYPYMALAEDFHVAPSGYPYTTIASAITAAGVNDTIYVHAGTYVENDLTPKEGMTISGVVSEVLPIIDPNVQTETHDWDDNPFHILYDNISLYRLDIRNGATGNVVIEDGGVDNFEMSYCELSRSSMTTLIDDNAGLLYVKGNTTNINIHHNKFTSHNPGWGGSIWFNPQGLASSFYNNECYQYVSGSCIFIKHAEDPVTGRFPIYNNFMYGDVGVGDNAASLAYVSTNDTDIYNNLVIGPRVGSGIIIGGGDSSTQGSGAHVYNNTVFVTEAIRGAFRIWFENVITDVTFDNNIFYRETGDYFEFLVMNAWRATTTRVWTGSYNLIQDIGSDDIFITPTDRYTMAEWKATGQGVGSYDETPVFVNGSGNLNEILDFEIFSGNALNGGSDGEDMGANVALIGINPGGESPGSNSVQQISGAYYFQ